LHERASQRTILRELLSSRSKPLVAVNINDQHDLTASLEAANRAQLPVILMVSARAIQYSGLPTILHLFRAASESSDVPVWLQLDHASDLSLIKEGVANNFDIVMADFSSKSMEENLRNTRKVVDLAHDADILVEGDVTIVPTDGLGERFTSPQEAKDFAVQTGVDLLAVSVGNRHGFARQKPPLNVNLIRSICSVINVPLVLHGADYCTSTAITQAARAGMTKFNFGPELREAYCVALRSAIKDCNWQTPDQRRILEAAKVAVREAILRRFQDLNAIP
jgi:fructose-bisphosphate aldolase, class II